MNALPDEPSPSGPTQASLAEPAWRRGATAVAFAALFVCFAITHFTNMAIARYAGGYLDKITRWVSRPTGRMQTPTGNDAASYLLVPVKDMLFFLCLVALGFLLWKAVKPLGPLLRRRRLWLDILIGFAIASVFLLMIRPAGMGMFYARISVDPFMTDPGFFHRRLLMPVLAHDLHLSGMLYGVFFWIVAALVFALASIYLETKRVTLSRIELASLYTIGMFASTLGLPGYGEILVLGLTLVALLDFDRTGRAGVVQLICFGLALLSHEGAAALAFGVLALFLFGPRFLMAYLAVLALYAALWLTSFGFDVQAATSAQLTDGKGNAEQFRATIPLVLLAVPIAYKLALVLVLAAIWRLARAGEYRMAALIGLSIVGATALTYVVTDYTRMVSFGTFAVLMAIPAVLPHLSERQRTTLAAVNLLIPTIYVGAHSGISTYTGLYGLVLTRLFGM